ncbi:FHA domain-containing protein [Agromyces sp. ISL-38]|uniref:FHA domain-containing protein n=1 Tax=Agromyces sp. ISL-38 TaxID=2819107 RepID=UPI001BEB79EB|nr:FHA domain-containing protein [Agromyces sp. ISL-38]MBT2499656.1 FHA domain-containing protein [Agromyces sp. ISL-38]MBT2516197.1 FHA domain-containing protein [Streptomyces sp. ISL-90]
MATYRHDPDAAWFAAVRGGVILVVPAEAADELATLWSDFASGDPTSRVLDRLTAQGLGATPSFALVVRDEGAGSARVVVRGPIVVRSGSTAIGGAGVSTWTERVIEGSGALSVEVDGADRHSSAALPVVEAIVPAISVTSEGIEPVAAVAAGAGVAPATAPTPAAAPTPIAMRPPPASSAASTVAEQTVAKPSEHAASPTPSLPAEQTMVSIEETVAGVSTPATPISAIVPPVGFASGSAAGDSGADPEFDGDHDGMTVASVDIRRLREQRAAQAGVATPAGGVAAASVTPNASLRMPDGTLEPIGHEVVLGRAPSVSKVSGGRIPRLLTIGAGDPDISRSHVRLTLEGDTVVITDLHSRNGTHVVAPGKAPVKLRSGEPTPVLTGTVVDLGGGWTVQVVGG